MTNEERQELRDRIARQKNTVPPVKEQGNNSIHKSDQKTIQIPVQKQDAVNHRRQEINISQISGPKDEVIDQSNSNIIVAQTTVINDTVRMYNPLPEITSWPWRFILPIVMVIIVFLMIYSNWNSIVLFLGSLFRIIVTIIVIGIISTFLFRSVRNRIRSWWWRWR